MKSDVKTNIYLRYFFRMNMLFLNANEAVENQNVKF